MSTHHQETPDIDGNHFCVHLRSPHFPCYFTAVRLSHAGQNLLKHVSKNLSHVYSINNNALPSDQQNAHIIICTYMYVYVTNLCLS